MSTRTGSAPVVLLHGVGLDRTVWRRVGERLDREHIALDLPGHGGQPPLTAATNLAALADDVASRMPSGAVHLVGFSLGSLIAQQIAATRPGRVLTLACVSSVCARTAEESEAVAGRLRAAAADFPGSMETALRRWFPDGVETEAGTHRTPDGTTGTSPGTASAVLDTTPAADLRAETRPVLMANDRDSYLYAYAVFATGDSQVAPLLSGIDVPTLAITGELDPGSTPDMSRRLANHIPNTRVVITPGARHMLPVTHPEALTRSLNELIDEEERNAT